MADTSKPGDDMQGTPAPEAPEGASAAGAEQSVPEAQLKDIIVVLQSDLDAAQSEKLRLIADMDNLRKRLEREKSDGAKYAITRFAQDIVGVADNFERAASAVPAEAAEKDPALKSFLEGVVLAEREFLSVLERHGVRRIEAQGQPFNPHQHQAVMEREDAGVPTGTVLQVFQAGFTIEERCLRPAMVVVSRGGPKAAKPADAPQPEGPAGPAATSGEAIPGKNGTA
jgi:molecular chaperone GrpE